ncbi:MAG: radical SAM protein [Dehalococcoidia bacterium]|nr:radical SAM protein [Dehalococcoidia bacterium]
MALTPNLRLIAWEITRSCNLLCAHCRASSTAEHAPGEFSTSECFSVIDNIVEVGRPIVILTGGEPLLRRDFFEIAKYATREGLRVAVGTNGTLITKRVAARLKEVPISRVGVSLDFPSANLQDRFRGMPGAYDAALKGAKNAINAGIDVQFNCTVTKLNVSYLEDLLALALELRAVAFHPFMLVPTGRGKNLAPQELEPIEYERVLNWIFDKQIELGSRIFFKPTDVPHYMRILAQRNHPDNKIMRRASQPEMNVLTRGCLAGTGFCFISHTGRVQGCGYLDVEAGNLRAQDFADVWRNSPLFNRLRDISRIKGKCGVCEYKAICGGCRARAYETTGDYLGEEPYCIHRPAGLPDESKRSA